jgi:hypothetical protein
MGGDAHVLGGDLSDWVDPVLVSAPPHVGPDTTLLDGPLAARPRHGSEIVRRVRELDDVQPARYLVGPHRGQVRYEVIKREQVAERVQHGNSEVEVAVDAEVPHVRLDDVQFEAGCLGLRRRVRAHRP